MKSKKILTIIVVAVLLIGGYGAIRYMENAVIGKIREAERLLAPHLSVGSARFSLWTKRLMLDDVRLHDETSGTSYEIKHLEGVLPLELVFDPPEGETELLSEWIAHGSTITMPGCVETIRTYRGAHLRANPSRLLWLLQKSAADGELFLTLMTNIAVGNDEAEEIHCRVAATPHTTAYAFSVKNAAGTQYMKGDYRSLEISDLRLTISDKEIAALDTLSLRGIHCPPLSTLKAVVNTPGTGGDVIPRDGLEALGLLQNLFTGPHPLVERIQLKNLTLKTPELPLHLTALTFDWPSSRPIRYSLDLEDLSLPVAALTAVLPDTRLPGLETLHLYLKDSVAHEADGRSREKLSLTVRDVASLRLDVELQGPSSPEGDTMLGLLSSQFVRAEAVLEDKRLLAYAGGNIDPSSVTAARQLENITERILALFLDPSSAASLREQLAGFVRRPGTLRLTFAPQAPVPVPELNDGAFDIASALTAVATPGPVSLEQQIRELFMPRNTPQP